MDKRIIRQTLPILTFLSLLMLGNSLFAVEFRIDFSNKDIYYKDSEIFLKATIHNDGNDAFFFRTADNRIFNLKISAKTLDNNSLPASSDYVMLRSSNRPYFYRDISLEPGEEYSFVFPLKQFIDITDAGVFIVQAEYFTDLSERNTLESNPIYLNVRPRVGMRPEYRERIDAQTQELLKRANLRPDETISYVLDSLIERSWNRFFLYMDLEYLMRQSSYYYRRYIASNEEERQGLIRNFRQAIIDGEIPEAASLADRPLRYEIIRTSYNKNEAEVLVNEEFDREGLKEYVRYTYYLHFKDNAWQVYRLSTQLLKNLVN